MKLAFVTDKIYPFYNGGYEKRYYELARRLSKKHEIHVYTSVKNPVRDGIIYHRVRGTVSYVGFDGQRNLSSDAIFALNLVRSFRPNFDIVDCNFIPPFLCWIPAIYSRFTRERLVLTVHETYDSSIGEIVRARNQDSHFGPVLNRVLPSFSKAVFHATLRAADVLIAVSSITGNSLQQHFPSRIVTIPNGVDISLCNNIEPDEDWACRDNHLVYVGRLSPEKNLDYLLLEMKRLKELGVSATLSLIGTGPLYDYLKAKIHSLGLDDNIFLHGSLDEPEKISIVKTASAFLLPSGREGFSIAALEAMACGVPVIAARKQSVDDSQGYFHYLVPGKNGLTFEYSRPKALASVAMEILGNKLRQKELAQGACETAREYDWDNICELYEKVILRF